MNERPPNSVIGSNRKVYYPSVAPGSVNPPFNPPAPEGSKVRGHHYLESAIHCMPIDKAGTIDEQFKKWGKGVEDSPFTAVAAGPALLRKPKTSTNATIVILDDDGNALPSADGGHALPEVFETVDEYEDLEAAVDRPDSKPGVKYGRTNPRFAPVLENDIDKIIKDNPSIDETVSDKILGITTECCASLRAKNIEYNPNRIAKVFVNLSYSGSATAGENEVSRMAREWDKGTLWHKLEITLAAVCQNIELITDVGCALDKLKEDACEVRDRLQKAKKKLESEVLWWEKKIAEQEEFDRETRDDEEKIKELELKKAELKATHGRHMKGGFAGLPRKTGLGMSGSNADAEAAAAARNALRNTGL